MDGCTDVRTEGLRITANKPSLKPRNKGQISEDVTSEDQTPLDEHNIMYQISCQNSKYF